MARNQGLSFYNRKKRVSLSFFRELFSWITGIVVAVLLAAFLNYWFGLSTYVVGDSMEPSLYNGQRIFVDRLSYVFGGPKEGDVILFLPNGNQNAHYYVKRVVAVPGDKLKILDGILYVNGKTSTLIPEKIEEAGIAGNEMILGKQEYFCIGDHPNESEDSRSADIGPIKSDTIIGKVWFHLKSEESGAGFVK